MPRFLPVVLVAVLFASCGSAERGRDAASVSNHFHAALEAGDGAEACEQLSGETASKLEESEGAPCEEAILDLDLPTGATSASAEVYVTSAYIDLADAGSVFLDKGREGWKVSAAGCRPPAADLPFECELEG
jgi:hypothetical protein